MPGVRALRGATTVDVDEACHVSERVQELLRHLLDVNSLSTDELISILFTATSDISSRFPAAAARELGLGDVPLIGAQELDVEGMLPRCIRLLAHVDTDKERSEITHVFLHEARNLRTDLVG